MTSDGLRINVKLDSIDISKGFFSEGAPANGTEIQFYGAVSFGISESLFDCGIDSRADSGSRANLLIQLENSPFYDIERNCVSPSIGWMEVSSSIFNDPEALNPVYFNLSIKLPNSDLPDIVAMSGCLIQIEPIFNRDENRKLITVVTSNTVQFNIQRIIFKPLLVNHEI